MASEITSYTNKGLTEIFDSDILNNNELKKLDNIKNGLQESWNYAQVFRTETEMRYAVLQDTKFPTNGMKYLQSRREQNVHFTELVRLSCKYEEKQGELLELEGELEEMEEKEFANEKIKQGKIKRLEAQIKQCRFALTQMRKTAKHRVREVATWEEIKEDLDDGTFDKKDLDSIQEDGYNLRWQRELESEMTSKQSKGNRIATLRGQLSTLTKEGR